jgi:hypothetical protein
MRDCFSSPDVTVLITTYGYGCFIEEAIESVLPKVYLQIPCLAYSKGLLAGPGPESAGRRWTRGPGAPIIAGRPVKWAFTRHAATLRG